VCTEENSSTCGDNALCMMQDSGIECRCFKGYVKYNDICVGKLCKNTNNIEVIDIHVCILCKRVIV
jgi:hypothetical protein